MSAGVWADGRKAFDPVAALGVDTPPYGDEAAVRMGHPDLWRRESPHLRSEMWGTRFRG
jgi:hypothetical protein